MPHSALRPLRHLRRLPLPRARQVRRRGAGRAAGAGAPQRHAADRRRRRSSSRPTPPARRSPRSWSSATAQRETLLRRHRRRLLRRGQLGQAAAGLGQRQAPERARQRLRPGRAATTCSTTARPCWRSPRSRTRRSSRRRSGSTTSTSAAADFEFPLGNIQMVGKSQAPNVPRREAAADQARAELDAARHRRATPSTSGSPPRTCRARRTASRWTTTAASRSRYTPTNDEPQASGCYDQLKSMLGHLGMHQRPPAPALRLPEERHPGRRRRPPGGHLPLRQRPGDLGARRQLPRARGRQPLRRRHELLPEHRRGEPGADRDGQRAARRRPPAGAPRAPHRRPEPACR